MEPLGVALSLLHEPSLTGLVVSILQNRATYATPARESTDGWRAAT